MDLTEQQIENLARHRFKCAADRLANDGDADPAGCLRLWNQSTSQQERFRDYARDDVALYGLEAVAPYLDSAPF